MHEMLIAAALTTGLLTTAPQMQARPGVISIAVAQSDWRAIGPATPAPAAAVARAKKIAPQHTIRQPRSTTILAASFIGALAGFYVGGHLGEALDQGGGSDSPGMAGAMYGACIGTAVGAVIGWKLAR